MVEHVVQYWLFCIYDSVLITTMDAFFGIALCVTICLLITGTVQVGCPDSPWDTIDY